MAYQLQKAITQPLFINNSSGNAELHLKYPTLETEVLWGIENYSFDINSLAKEK